MLLDTLDLTLTDLAKYAAGFSLIYGFSLIAYRVWFHPLRHIPGPPLAKATFLYEWYYDLYLGGQFTFQLRTLHEEYGPVIRINPDEVHILDHDYFDKMYNLSNGRANKTLRATEAFGPYPSALGTQMHELHRLRRSAISPFFSKGSVNTLVPDMRRPIEALRSRLDDASRNKTLLNMKYMYAAVAQDIINEYCFARPMENVFKPDFGRKQFDDIDSFTYVSLVNLHMLWVLRLSNALPDWVNKILSPAIGDLLDFRQSLARQVEDIRDGRDKAHEAAGHRTIFHEILGNSKLPPQELQSDRLRDEAFTLMTAGSGTTAYVLRGTSYHIAANPSISQRLYEELKHAIPDPSNPPPVTVLEKLPYLAAVIQEGLRMGEPVTHRLPLQFPDKDLHCNGYTIPAGSTACMTTCLTHLDPTIFPSPQTFNPERWLGTDGKRLERYLFPFGRGTRACVGINLARAELMLLLAMVFREFELDVSRVDRKRDVDVSFDYILAAQAHDSRGLLVGVKRRED